MIAVSLKCNGLSEPIGIGQQPIRLSWQCEGGKRQSAWQVNIFSGEALDENGNFTLSNFQPGPNHKAGQVAQRIEYICRPGENRYRPEFCIFGFRYVRVTGDISAEKLALTAHAVYSDMPQTGFLPAQMNA